MVWAGTAAMGVATGVMRVRAFVAVFFSQRANEPLVIAGETLKVTGWVELR